MHLKGVPEHCVLCKGGGDWGRQCIRSEGETGWGGSRLREWDGVEEWGSVREEETQKRGKHWEGTGFSEIDRDFVRTTGSQRGRGRRASRTEGGCIVDSD